ncbi:MAG: hypothetical protein ACJ71N_06760 [Terriglobales bacterium]
MKSLLKPRLGVLCWIFSTSAFLFAAAGTANDKLADQFAVRLHHIQQNGIAATPDTAPTVLPDNEGNAYFAAGRVKLPASVQQVRYATTPGTVNAVARIDFDKLTQNSTSNNPLLSLFTGVHDVRVIADASAKSGTATVTAQSVEIDGIPVPRMALEYFVNKYLTSRFPNVGMTSHFKLPSKVDSATVGQAQVTVNQR